MSSTNQYLEFVLDLLGELDDVAHRKMMGEYVLYYRGKVIGISVTKQGFTKTMSKILPLIGGVISGGMTFVSLQTQANRLRQHLRQLPPPGLDASTHTQL